MAPNLLTAANSLRTTDIQTVELRVEDLQPFPRQGDHFPEEAPEEIAALAADIQANGLQHSIEVRADRKTIIAGHRRVQAVRSLGWTTIPAVIRHDLEAKGELAIEAYFISDNFSRRQLTQLGQARCAKRLIEIDAERAGGSDRRVSARELQKRVGERLGITDRQVRRLLRVLTAPHEVQVAYEAGHLQIDDAGKVADLDVEKQQAIVEEIAEGDNPKQVVSRYLADRRIERESANRQYHKLVNSITRTVEPLRNRISDISVNVDRVDQQIAVLERGADVINKVIARLNHLKTDRRIPSELAQQLPANVALRSARPEDDTARDTPIHDLDSTY